MTRFLLRLIRCYQRFVSPLTGGVCRFEPSCSRYAHVCFEHLPASRASTLTLWRLVRCNPLCRGGIDLPPLPHSAPAADRTPDYARIARIFGTAAAHEARPPVSFPASPSSTSPLPVDARSEGSARGPLRSN